MDKNYLIEKWLKNELTEAEKQSFSKLDDAEFNQNIIDNAIHFKASHHAKINDFNTFKTHYDSQNTPIKKLNWWSPLIKIASVLVITLGVYFAFFNNSKTSCNSKCIKLAKKACLSIEIFRCLCKKYKTSNKLSLSFD